VSDHPVATAVRERRSEVTGDAAYLPLIVATGGLDLVIGVLAVQWTAAGPRTATDQAVLAGVTDLLAVAVDRARLSATAAERSDWFERMAHTDPLTGLANERTVGRILELELARAGRQGGEVSIVMFDIDDFQATNRDGGHQAGDDVLRRVAAVLAESVRLVDTVGRIGGDEFVLVAPGSAGLTVARRVLEGIVSLPAVAGRPITVSAGVARFPADGTDAASLIEAATAALAQARADGRGHAVLSPIIDEG
jgi:diguanylate cyclase (GGDEF)-like protein